MLTQPCLYNAQLSSSAALNVENIDLSSASLAVVRVYAINRVNEAVFTLSLRKISYCLGMPGSVVYTSFLATRILKVVFSIQHYLKSASLFTASFFLPMCYMAGILRTRLPSGMREGTEGTFLGVVVLKVLLGVRGAGVGGVVAGDAAAAAYFLGGTIRLGDLSVLLTTGSEFVLVVG